MFREFDTFNIINISLNRDIFIIWPNNA